MFLACGDKEKYGSSACGDVGISPLTPPLQIVCSGNVHRKVLQWLRQVGTQSVLTQVPSSVVSDLASVLCGNCFRSLAEVRRAVEESRIQELLGQCQEFLLTPMVSGSRRRRPFFRLSQESAVVCEGHHTWTTVYCVLRALGRGSFTSVHRLFLFTCLLSWMDVPVHPALHTLPVESIIMRCRFLLVTCHC